MLDVLSPDESITDWEKLPLFPDLPPCAPIYRAENGRPFNDEFLDALTSTGPLQRLKQIGFLGAIDYVRFGNGRQSHRRRHNRYDHSVGVAQLALTYSRIRGISTKDTRTLAAAGLLHDIGHGPLSHTLEPVFKEVFGISHHQVGNNILYGNTPFGEEIKDIMSSFRVDLDEVVAMISGTHDGPHAFLFSSPINLDTIEGITRSRSFAARSGAGALAERIVHEIAHSETLPEDTLDQFWGLKHEVYNMVIHNPWGLIFDGLAQAFMDCEIDSFDARDFMKTEFQLRHKQPLLFHIFAWAKKSKRRAYYRVSELVPNLLRYKLRAPKRSFHIDSSVSLNSIGDLTRRYKQTKAHRMITIGNLVDAEQHLGGL